jgi:uncharacterized membrane protein YphA (DoxX/SURF4 family)
MLASIFIYGGVDALRNPGPRIDEAEDLVDQLSDRVDAVPDDTAMLVRANGALQVGAGLALATNTMSRPAALALAASLVPTTVAGHRFWEQEGSASRQGQLVHFLKNLGLLGGLIITALDTEGEPGVAWRAQHAIEHAGIVTDHKKEVAGLHAELARERARAVTAGTRSKVKATAKQARRDAKIAGKAGRSASHAVGNVGRGAKRAVKAISPL